jgi:murein DD-endopeptidase MepM/ murein hydrolase activator NlpD
MRAVIKMLGWPRSDRLLDARVVRASRARADLLRARGLAPDPPPAPRAPTVSFGATLREALLTPWASIHAIVLALVAIVLAGELLGSWSVTSTARRSAEGYSAVLQPPDPLDLRAPVAIGPLRLAAPELTPPAPPIQRPAELTGVYQAYHPLGPGETLGQVAERYGVSVGSLVWANGLDRGDALIEGQLLRIPRVAGLPHVVAEGDTLEDLAERFGVAAGAIAAFAPNGIGPDLRLQPGVELFVPGGARAPVNDWLSSIGGLEAMALRAPEAAGVVRERQTNLRAGPSTEHPRLLQLDAGRQVALRARHADWLLVELGGARGWIRQDMLAAPAEQVAALPLTDDFPPPPPRWVWPARGSISSRFGPRWGGFHNGLDIANRAWTPIVAARAGVVKESGWCSGYGYCVKLRHDGGVETIYGHLIARPLVARGDEVSAGELIGHMGSTYDRAGGGYSTGVHLHFTVYVNGRAVDPLRFLP